MWLSKAASIPPLLQLVNRVLASPAVTRMKFILDPTSMPAIIKLSQDLGWQVLETVFYMTRTYTYGLHRKKLIVVGKWPYSTRNENCNIQNNLFSFSGTETATKRTYCPQTDTTVAQWPVQTDMLVSSVPHIPALQPNILFPSPPIHHQAAGLD